MFTLLLVLLSALLLLGAALALYWYGGKAERERQRQAAEVHVAEWQIREVTRLAMARILDEARRQL